MGHCLLQLNHSKEEEEKDTTRKMCYEAKCSNCGKSSWQGCGSHVAAVYNRIPEGQHCHCKAWPGVSGEKTAAAADDSKGFSTCTIL